MAKMCLWAQAGGTDQESFKLESIGTASGKLRADMASPESGNATGSICTAPGSMEGSALCLKCLYTNTHSMRNKQDELEVLVSSQSCNITGISET